MGQATSAAAPAIPTDSTAGLLPVAAATVAPGSTVLTVGVGKEYATIGAAVAAAQAGNTVLIDPGTYTNDFATVSAAITIEGNGGMVNLVATQPPPNLKGIITVDNSVTIKNLSFSGAAVGAGDGGNGAGIRYEGGAMVLENDSFSRNQNGILAAAVIPGLAANTITIDHSLFSGNGSGSGNTHNVYVSNGVSSLTFTNTISEGAVVGHELKSRAATNVIEGNVFQDGPAGTASYEIDLPDGGNDLVEGNVIEKGPNAQNDAMVHFGGEGIPYANSSLTVQGNDFVNDLGGNAAAVLNQTAISAAINGNTFSGQGFGAIAEGPATGTDNDTGAGVELADISLVGVLPGNTQVFTDDLPHTVTLTGGDAVEGGGGLLSVNDPGGHVVAIGGSGGMTFTEGAGVGGSSIATAAGSASTITLDGGYDTIDSEGADAISNGSGNQTVKVGGSATVQDGTGNNTYSVVGTASIVGQGGNPVISVGSGAVLSLTGKLGFFNVQNDGGTVTINALVAGNQQAISILGGGVQLETYDNLVNVTTAPGSQGATITVGAGTTQISSQGADAIHAGSGADTVIVSGAAKVYAGTGALSVFGRGDTAGASVYGNGGSVTLDGDTGNITYYGGALASTVQSRLSNDTLIGGAGHMTVNGGSRETITGGSGGITYAATDGGGADTITTAAGSRNTLVLSGPDSVVSQGTDTISAGVANQAITVDGNSAVTGSTGNSWLTFNGNDSFTGKGQDWITVNAGAVLAATAGSNTSVSETGAKVGFTVAAGANAARVSVSGGSASISGGTSAGDRVSVTTRAGASTGVSLVSGNAMATLNGADTATAGSGTGLIMVTAANCTVTGGSGALTVRDYDNAMRDAVTVRGGTGALSYDQGGAALRFIGGAGAATINGEYGSLNITGGSGSLAVSGGGLGTTFVAGTGKANVALTPGGGVLTLGRGATAVQVAGFGAADVFNFVAGSGGGTDTIAGFRNGTDSLALHGVKVASETVSGGSVNITLSDKTHIQLMGDASTSGLFASNASAVRA